MPTSSLLLQPISCISGVLMLPKMTSARWGNGSEQTRSFSMLGPVIRLIRTSIRRSLGGGSGDDPRLPPPRIRPAHLPGMPPPLDASPILPVDAMNLHEALGDALAIFVGIGAGALVAVLLRG